MRSAVQDILPLKLKRALLKLGSDIAIARRKGSLTSQMMAERLAISKSTYARVEKGDPTVSLGVYAMTFFVLGFQDTVGDLVDPSKDREGLLLDVERLPKRVRVKKQPRPL